MGRELLAPTVTEEIIQKKMYVYVCVREIEISVSKHPINRIKITTHIKSPRKSKRKKFKKLNRKKIKNLNRKKMHSGHEKKINEGEKTVTKFMFIFESKYLKICLTL